MTPLNLAGVQSALEAAYSVLIRTDPDAYVHASWTGPEGFRTTLSIGPAGEDDGDVQGDEFDAEEDERVATLG